MNLPSLRVLPSRARRWLAEQISGWRARPWSRAEVWAVVAPKLATAVTFVVPIYVFLLFNDGIRYSGGGGDEGYFTWCGWSLAKGLRPYVDFMEFKPPFVFLSYALALKLYGFDHFGFRTFFTYFPLLSIVALQASLLTRRIDKVLAMGLSLAVIHLWVTRAYHDGALSDTESIGLSYYFLGVAFLLARTRFAGAAQAIGTGLLICCALSKDPFLPCVVVTWAACFLAQPRTGALREDALRYLKRSSIGGAVVLGGLIVYMLPTGALRAYLNIVKRYQVLYRDPVQSFCVAGGVFKPTTPLNDLYRQARALTEDFASVARMGFLLPFLAALGLSTRRRTLPLVLLALVVLLTSFFAVIASNCPWKHYYNMFLAGVVFVVVVGLDLFEPHLARLSPTMRWMTRIAMLTGLAVAVWPRIQAERPLYGTRAVPPTMTEPAPGVFELIRKYTTPSDRIVTNGNPILYVQVNRIAGVRESNFLDPILSFYVGDSDEEKLRPVYDEMMRSRPKIVVLDPSFGYARARHHKALWWPFLTNNHYKRLTDNVYLRPD
ncbi:MAG TPA: hypothetical protein VHO06_28380 [Polyangia bacterium]|nr:hypothetical protein [Polyangia bacterium]